MGLSVPFFVYMLWMFDNFVAGQESDSWIVFCFIFFLFVQNLLPIMLPLLSLLLCISSAIVLHLLGCATICYDCHWGVFNFRMIEIRLPLPLLLFSFYLRLVRKSTPLISFYSFDIKFICNRRVLTMFSFVWVLIEFQEL